MIKINLQILPENQGFIPTFILGEVYFLCYSIASLENPKRAMENQGKGQGQGSQVETPDPDLLGGSYGAGNYGMCGRAYDPRYLHPNTVCCINNQS